METILRILPFYFWSFPFGYGIHILKQEIQSLVTVVSIILQYLNHLYSLLLRCVAFHSLCSAWTPILWPTDSITNWFTTDGDLRTDILLIDWLIYHIVVLSTWSKSLRQCIVCFFWILALFRYRQVADKDKLFWSGAEHVFPSKHIDQQHGSAITNQVTCFYACLLFHSVYMWSPHPTAPSQTSWGIWGPWALMPPNPSGWVWYGFGVLGETSII